MQEAENPTGTAEAPTWLSEVARCPDCRARLVWGDSEVGCAACGRSWRRLGRVVRFLDPPSSLAGAIRGWSVEVTRRILDDLAAARAGSPRPGDEILTPLGLVDDAGRPTIEAERLLYHVDESRWQSDSDPLQGYGDRVALRDGDTAVDVGCGAGQTLRHLARIAAIRGIGVDMDPNALALGDRISATESEGGASFVPEFLSASAHALPLADASASLVVSRVAINYMNQRRALGEMARVLKPGGWLVLRYERCWHDAVMFRRVGPKGKVAGARDFAFGCLLALTGLQPTPGSRLSGGRAFATTRGLSATLRRLDCEPLDSSTNFRSNHFLGRPTQRAILARKLPG